MKITYASVSISQQNSLERLQARLSFKTDKHNTFFNINFLTTARHREYKKNILQIPDWTDWEPYQYPIDRSTASSYIGRGYHVNKFVPGRSQPHVAYDRTCALIELDQTTSIYKFQCWISECQLEMLCLPVENISRITHKGEYRDLTAVNSTRGAWEL